MQSPATLKSLKSKGRRREESIDALPGLRKRVYKRALDRMASGLTVEAMAEDYRDHYLRTEVDTADEMWRLLEKDLPVWGDRQFDLIDGYDLTQILDEILARGAA